MDTEKVTTRLQLRGYGATRYQAQAITKNLTAAVHQGRAYAYPVSDVVASIREYLQRPRVQPATRKFLKLFAKLYWSVWVTSSKFLSVVAPTPKLINWQGS
jgi:hypothetical protein